MIQFCKVIVKYENPIVIKSLELLLEPMDYIKFIQDDKQWDNLIKNGITQKPTTGQSSDNYGYYHIDINHKFTDDFSIELSKQIKYHLRDEKLNKLLI